MEKTTLGHGRLLLAIAAAAIAMLCTLTMLAPQAYADKEGSYTYTTNNGVATITGCDTTTKGDIVVPDTLGGCPVKTIAKRAFSYCSSITGITVPHSVTSIGEEAFSRCIGLKTITLPDTIKTIDKNTFYDCSALTSIVIPGSVTSIATSAFDECTSLESVVIPASVTSIGNRAFAKCRSLKSVTIPNSVKALGDSAFLECTSLKSASLSTALTSINYSAFNKCASLEDITIPNSVTSIGDYAFSGCVNLSRIFIPASVKTVGESAFPYATNREKNVFYGGSDAQWDKISFAANKSGLATSASSTPVHSNARGISNFFAGKPATCTEPGLKDYYERDGKYYGDPSYTAEVTDLAKWRVIPAAGHKAVKIPGIKATIDKEGLSTGSKCSVCGKVLKKQKILPRKSLTFVDVKKSGAKATPHAEDIIWMGNKHISEGWLKGKKRYFYGTRDVVRQDMAAFLRRLADLHGIKANRTLAYGFADVTSKTPHADDIKWLANNRISEGWSIQGKHKFKGEEVVRRQDMAAFLYRLADLSNDGKLNNNAKVGPKKLKFKDVNSKTPHAKEINWLASWGISTGWKEHGKYYFKGTETVNRQDMAAFMHRLSNNISKF